MSLRTVAATDAEVVSLDEGLAADRLGRLHVVLHDGAKHHEPAVLAHPSSSRSSPRLALSIVECQVYAVGPRCTERLVPCRGCRAPSRPPIGSVDRPVGAWRHGAARRTAYAA